jgi:choline dehydrogenase
MRLGEHIEFRASAEVIVSCGAYNSPQLLMLSGIGRPDELAALQIPPVAEIPGVGLNLIDHPMSGVVYLSDREGSLFGALNEHSLAHFQTRGCGPLTSNAAEAGGFVRTREGLDAPDVQFHFVPALFVQEGLVPGQAHGFTLAASVVKPRSRGQVTLVSPDPTVKPFIIHNYYNDPEDLRVQVAGVRLAMRIANTAPLAQWASAPYLAPASDSDEDITAHPRTDADDLSPGRHLQNGHGRHGSCRPAATGARYRGPARGRRLNHGIVNLFGLTSGGDHSVRG